MSIKITIVGDKNVGKSTFVTRLLQQEYIPVHSGVVEYMSTRTRYHGNEYNVMAWVCNGESKFQPVVRGYYRGMDIVLIVVNNSDLQFLNSIAKWVEDVEKYKGEYDPIVGIVLLQSSNEKSNIEFDVQEVSDISASYKVMYWDINPRMNLNIFLHYLIDLVVARRRQIEKDYEEVFLNKPVPKCMSCTIL